GGDLGQFPVQLTMGDLPHVFGKEITVHPQAATEVDQGISMDQPGLVDCGSLGTALLDIGLVGVVYLGGGEPDRELVPTLFLSLDPLGQLLLGNARKSGRSQED